MHYFNTQNVYVLDMQKFPLRMKDNDLLVTELYHDPSNDAITALSVYLTPKTSQYLAKLLQILDLFLRMYVYLLVYYAKTNDSFFLRPAVWRVSSLGLKFIFGHVLKPNMTHKQAKVEVGNEDFSSSELYLSKTLQYQLKLLKKKKKSVHLPSTSCR